MFRKFVIAKVGIYIFLLLCTSTILAGVGPAVAWRNMRLRGPPPKTFFFTWSWGDRPPLAAHHPAMDGSDYLSRNSSITAVTGYPVDSLGSFFFSTPSHLDRFWVHPASSSVSTGGCFPDDKAPGLQLIPRYKMHGANLHAPIHLCAVVLN
jgi:hypothetical protein